MSNDRDVEFATPWLIFKRLTALGAGLMVWALMAVAVLRVSRELLQWP